MDVAVAPVEHQALARPGSKRLEFVLGQDRGELAGVLHERQEMMRALVFDRPHRRGEAAGTAALRAQLEPVRAQRDLSRRRRDHIVTAHELGDERRARGVEYVARATRLLDAPAIHQHHEIGERHRLVLAVRDVQERDAELLLQPLQLGAHLDAQERIERGERLVEQENARLRDQRAGKRDALLLPAGQLRRQPRGVWLHVHEAEHVHRLGVALRPSDAAHLQREGHIVDRGQMRKQRVALEHHRGAARLRRQISDVLVADQDVARGCGLVTGDEAQGRGLAAAGGAEQAAIGVGRHFQVDRVDRGRAAVGLGQRCKLEA